MYRQTNQRNIHERQFNERLISWSPSNLAIVIAKDKENEPGKKAMH